MEASEVRVKTVSVTYERKVNTGNYGSASIGMTAWADLAPDADTHDTMNLLWDFVRRNVECQLRERGGGLHDVLPVPDDAWLGLPEPNEDGETVDDAGTQEYDVPF